MWCEARRRNADWLRPWESTLPYAALDVADPSLSAFHVMRRTLAHQGRLGTALPFAMTYAGRLVGQVTVSAVVRGSMSSATIGYWIDREVAGRGITPISVALVVDHCFGAVALHRVELNIRPENEASRRVATKLGFREEGLRRRYLHIDGGWRDHLGYALTKEDVPGGLLRRLLSQSATTPSRGAVEAAESPAEQPGDTPTRLPADEHGGR